MATRRFFLGTSISLLLALAAMTLVVPGTAIARQDPTPTPVPLSDFVIPTSTPAAAEEPAPTATSAGGGIVIPTATPSTPAGPALPALSDEQLIALNIQPGDVPAEFAASQQVQAFDTAEVVSQLNAGGYAELADAVQQLAESYGWTTSQGVSYTYCQPNLPVDQIRSEVAQLDSAGAARAFLGDPVAQNLFEALGYTGDFAENVHGWRMTLPQEGVCFAQETEYSLMFDYWGLVVSVAMTADANTDPGLVWGLLDQLAAMTVARADALTEEPFPPTPTAGAETEIVPPTEQVIIESTIEVMTAVPTEMPAVPTEIPIASPTPVVLVAPTETAEPAPAALTLEDLDALMPTIQEIGLPSPPFNLNEESSGIFTFDEVVQLAADTGIAELAQAIEEAGRGSGMIGQVMRIWDTGDVCPDTPALSLEVDLTLYETAEGAQQDLNDEQVQQAWLNTGVFQSFDAQPDGSVLAKGSFAHSCGQVSVYVLSTVQGRVGIAVNAIATEGASEQDILTALNVLSGYMASRIGETGLE